MVVQVEVAYSAYVDSVYGSAAGQLNAPAYPFLTIMMAINAILSSGTPPSIYQQWNVEINPGTYVENVFLPGFINLVGSDQATTIVGTLTLTGASIVEDLLIDTTNAPSVVINRGDNAGDSAFQNVVIFSTYTGTYTSPITVINAIQGDATFESGAIFATFSATAPAASIVYSGGRLSFFNVLNELTINPGITSFKIFNVFGDKSTITECAITIAFNGGNSAAIIAANVTASMKENRIMVTSNGTREFDVVYATDGSDIILTHNYFDFAGVLPQSALYLARGVHSSGSDNNKPIVKFLSDEFVTTEIPPYVGTFGQISYDLFDQQADFKFNGGFYPQSINKIGCGTYTVKETDFTILVTCNAASIILPTGRAGQLIYIKNIASSNCQVQGSMFATSSPYNHPSQSTLVLQSDGTVWYVLGN